MAVRGVRAGIGGVRRRRLIPLLLSLRRTVTADRQLEFSLQTSCADGGTLLRRGSVKPRAASMKGMWCTITLGSCVEHHCSISERSMSPPVSCVSRTRSCVSGACRRSHRCSSGTARWLWAGPLTGLLRAPPPLEWRDRAWQQQTPAPSHLNDVRCLPDVLPDMYPNCTCRVSAPCTGPAYNSVNGGTLLGSKMQ